MTIIITKYLSSGLTEVASLDSDDCVCVMVQITNKLFQTVEATNSTFQTAFCAI